MSRRATVKCIEYIIFYRQQQLLCKGVLAKNSAACHVTLSSRDSFAHTRACLRPTAHNYEMQWVAILNAKQQNNKYFKNLIIKKKTIIIKEANWFPTTQKETKQQTRLATTTTDRHNARRPTRRTLTTTLPSLTTAVALTRKGVAAALAHWLRHAPAHNAVLWVEFLVSLFVKPAALRCA